MRFNDSSIHVVTFPDSVHTDARTLHADRPTTFSLNKPRIAVLGCRMVGFWKTKCTKISSMVSVTVSIDSNSTQSSVLLVYWGLMPQQQV